MNIITFTGQRKIKETYRNPNRNDWERVVEKSNNLKGTMFIATCSNKLRT